MRTACQLSDRFSVDRRIKPKNQNKSIETHGSKKVRMRLDLTWCVDLRVGASWRGGGVVPASAAVGGGGRPGAQPSDTGGDTQPYFSWVFTRDLKVASASLRLNAFLDFPAFLHMRPCPFTRLAANCLMTASTV